MFNWRNFKLREVARLLLRQVLFIFYSNRMHKQNTLIEQSLLLFG